MAGFIRRYRFSPGIELITQIEGVIIVDLPPPGSINGVGTGTACIIGEFADMTYACNVSSSGVVTSNPVPVEVFSSQDMVDKVGGFDELLGEFGVSMGNGFVEIRNKKFARLIVVPVDLITAGGGTNGTLRVWRELPTNTSATDTTPIVPVAPASVSAGREFRNSGNRARLAQRVFFGDSVAYKSAIDGAITAAGSPALTQTFSSATGNFVNLGVKEGDVLVLGVIGGAGALGANAGTYRVVSVTSATALVVQRMDGATFDWTTGTAQPYRLHVGTTADSGPLNQFNEAGGYSVLARPLDATLATGALLAPTVAPPAATASTWDSLSGLNAAVNPSTALTYLAAVHAPGAAANSTIDARYQAAIDATLSDDYPARDINMMTCARKSATIRSKLLSHVGVAAERGLTRRAIISPALSVQTLSAALADSDPGVGGNRSDRIDYSWPGVRTSIPEANGYSLATSDSKTTSDGLLDVTADTFLMSVESSLPPERNPGQAAEPVPTVLAPVLGFQRTTAALRLGLPEYTQLRSRGVCAIRFDKTSGPIFQSGVTTSLLSGEKNIFRRRMADFIQDSLSQRLVQLSKLPLTESLKNTAVGEVSAFLTDLLSPNNPSASRIDAFEVDDVSGNTPATLAKGIYVIIVRVKLTPTSDFIVLQTEIGEGVVITEA